MSTFVEAVKNQEARTTNGMKANKSTANACVDLFFKVGASRGKDVIPSFVAALVENEDIALRIVQWTRDVRGGAGERKLFRDILGYLDKNRPELAMKLLPKVPEIGRWDDIFIFENKDVKAAAYTMLGDALRARNGLAAKWTPRQGPIAVEVRKFFGMSPKFYRKSLVELSKTVEQNMCSKNWDEINFSHVPSLAHARYKKAFGRNTPKYAEYVQALVKGDDPKVKVNAAAVYPYDVLKGVIGKSMGYGKPSFSKTELDLVVKQWEALPNYVGDANVLALVDVSGSMTVPVGGMKSGSSSLSCLDVAVSLGLYVADKNKGKFKDTFLTFSTSPELMHLKGNVVEKTYQMVKSNWSMGTNLHAAFDKILKTALLHNVPASEMPEMLLIMSDMQFNCCGRFDDSAMQMIERKYAASGYVAPKVVFWNLNSHDNVPVKFDKSGAALVSGFSPSILKALLAGKTDQFTPEGVMMEALMIPRYDI